LVWFGLVCFYPWLLEEGLHDAIEPVNENRFLVLCRCQQDVVVIGEVSCDLQDVLLRLRHRSRKDPADRLPRDIKLLLKELSDLLRVIAIGPFVCVPHSVLLLFLEEVSLACELIPDETIGNHSQPGFSTRGLDEALLDLIIGDLVSLGVLRGVLLVIHLQEELIQERGVRLIDVVDAFLCAEVLREDLLDGLLVGRTTLVGVGLPVLSLRQCVGRHCWIAIERCADRSSCPLFNFPKKGFVWGVGFVRHTQFF
jgi:hypothetical protein